MKRARGPIIAIILSLLATYLTYVGASEAAAGATREFTGRRSGIQNLFYGIGQDYGMAAVLLGILVCGLSVYWLLRALRAGS